MSLLPRVTELTRQRIARELDDVGPAAIASEAVARLSAENPELLDMAQRWARDTGDADQAMVGLGAFYRLLTLEARLAAAHPALADLPRVSPPTRDLLVDRIEDEGEQRFTTDTVEHMHEHNPQLLQMAHSFASDRPVYLQAMQGFCLIYAALVAQSSADRVRLH